MYVYIDNTSVKHMLQTVEVSLRIDADEIMSWRIMRSTALVRQDPLCTQGATEPRAGKVLSRCLVSLADDQLDELSDVSQWGRGECGVAEEREGEEFCLTRGDTKLINTLAHIPPVGHQKIGDSEFFFFLFSGGGGLV